MPGQSKETRRSGPLACKARPRCPALSLAWDDALEVSISGPQCPSALVSVVGVMPGRHVHLPSQDWRGNQRQRDRGTGAFAGATGTIKVKTISRTKHAVTITFSG